MNILTLNPLIEALKGKVPINKVFISNTRGGKKVGIILDLCRKNKVAYQFVPQQTITRKAGPNNQGVFAEIAPVSFFSLDDILNQITTGIILILDRINDTGNLGAIIRSAVAADVDGIIISKRHSAPINETVLNTSAGTLLNAKLCRSSNLLNTIKRLKMQKFWIVGTTKEEKLPYYNYDFSDKTAIILGSEQQGISQLLVKAADTLVSIPHSLKVESLNVSAAASVILFEILRQKSLNQKNTDQE
jgi:23S rRNA (guanosine2251-2'-O)-methyltransferase